MTPSDKSTEIADALLNPTAVFDNPAALLAREDISRVAKIEILRRWEYDSNELAVAEEESMDNGEPNMLDQVLKALHALDAAPDVEHSPPTKQRGV